MEKVDSHPRIAVQCLNSMYIIPKFTYVLQQWQKRDGPFWLKCWVGRRRRSVCLLTLWIALFALSFSGTSIWLVSKRLPVCLCLLSLVRPSPLIAADNWANSLSPFIIVLAAFEIPSNLGTLCEDYRHNHVASSCHDRRIERALDKSSSTGLAGEPNAVIVQIFYLLCHYSWKRLACRSV